MQFSNFDKVNSTGKKNEPAGEKSTSTTMKFSNFDKANGINTTVTKTPKQVSVEKQIKPATSQVVTPVAPVTPPVKKESILLKVAKTLFYPFFIQSSLRTITKPVTDELDTQVKKVMNTPTGQTIAKVTADSTTGSALVLATPSAFMKATRDIITGGGNGKDIIDYYSESIQKSKKASQDPTNSFGEQIARGVFDSGVQSLVGVATSLIPYVGKPLSVAYWGAISSASQIEEKGKVTSLGNIGIDVAGDMLLGNLVEGILKKPVTALTKAGFRKLTQTASGFVVEGTTESAQTILKYANDYRNATTDKERQAVVDQAKQYVKGGGILKEFLIGGIAGGLITGGASFGANSQNVNMPKPVTGITEDKDKEATPEQLAYRKAFREDVKRHLASTNENIEETSALVSQETGMDINLVTEMVKEIASTKVTFSDTKFEMTASELRNEIAKTQDLNQKTEMQLELNNFFELGSITEFNTPDVTIKTFEYDDGKYAVSIVANTPDAGINQSFENSKLYDSQKQAVADAKAQVATLGEYLLEEPKVLEPVQTVKQRTESAIKLGEKAFREGKKATPSADKDLMKLMEGLEVGEGTPIMEAWSKAWHKANLAPEKTTLKKIQKKVQEKKEAKMPVKEKKVKEKPVKEKKTKKAELQMKPSDAKVEGAPKNDLIVRKTDVKNLLQNSPEFKANPVFTVDSNLQLVFTSPKTTFKIKARALNLNTMAIKEGDVIEVDVKSLSEKGAGQQLRVFKGTEIMYQRAKEADMKEKFITNEQVVKELSKYFNDGEIQTIFLDKILMRDGAEAWGRYADGVIKFVNNPIEETPSHEAMHAFLDLFMSPENKQLYLKRILTMRINEVGEAQVNKEVKELQNQYRGKLTEEQARNMYAEELLAVDFSKQVKNSQHKSFFSKLWNKIIYFIHRITGQTTPIRLYNDILTKKRAFVKKTNKPTLDYFQKEIDKFTETTRTIDRIAKEIKSTTVSKETIEQKIQMSDVSKMDKYLISEVLKDFDDKVNVAEFLNKAYVKIMPVSLIRTTASGSYANYGVNRLNEIKKDGNVTANKKMEGQVSPETHLWDTPYRQGQVGHFGSIFSNIVIDYEIIERTNPETGKPIFFIVRKGAELNETNVQDEVAGMEDSKEKAERAIVELRKIQESNSGIKAGLGGHSRIGTERTREYILETLSKKLLIVKDDISRSKEILTNLEKAKKYLTKNKKELANRFQKGMDKLVDKAIKTLDKAGDSNTKTKLIESRFSGYSFSYIFDKAYQVESSSDGGWSDSAQRVKWVKETMGDLYTPEFEKLLTNPNDNVMNAGLNVRLLRMAEVIVSTSFRGEGQNLQLGVVAYTDSLEEQIGMDYVNSGIKDDEEKIRELEQVVDETRTMEADKFPSLARYIFEIQSDPAQSRYKIYSRYTRAVAEKKYVDMILEKLKSDNPFFTKDEVASRDGFNKVDMQDAIKILNQYFDKDENLSFNRGEYSENKLKESNPLDFAYDSNVVSFQNLSDKYKKLVIKGVEKAQSDLENTIKREEPLRTDTELQYFAMLDKFHERIIKEEIRLTAQDLIKGDVSEVPLRIATPFTIGVIESSIEPRDWKIKDGGIVREGEKDVNELALREQGEIGDIGAPRLPESMDKEYDTDFLVSKKSDLAEQYLDKLSGDKYYEMFGTVNGDVYEILKKGDDFVLTQADKEILPYEWNGGYTNPDLDDNIDMYGSEYQVVEIDGDTMKLAKSDRVRIISRDELIDGEYENEVSEISYEFKNLEKKYGEIATPEQAQKVLDEEQDNYDYYTLKYILERMAQADPESPMDFDDALEEQRDYISDGISDRFSDIRDIKDMYGADEVLVRESGYSEEYVIIEEGADLQEVNTPESSYSAISEFELSTEEAIKLEEEFVNNGENTKDSEEYEKAMVEYRKKVEEVKEKYKQIRAEQEKGLLPKLNVNPDGSYIFDISYLKDDDSKSVYNYYDKKVIPYFKKLRKDWTLYTDERGYQWYQTIVTEKDLEKLEVYMPKAKPLTEDEIVQKMQPIEIPEIITLARNLTGQTPKIKQKMGNKRGYFRGAGGGIIAINANLFEKGNEIQVAKTLAHEVGHLADWLPDHVSGRGNLVGRIMSLRKFMSSTFDKGLQGALKLDEFRSKALKQILAEEGIKYGDYLTTKAIRDSLKDKISARYNVLVADTGAIRNPEINAELTKVTEYWRPYDKAKVSESHRKYRNSSSEKYADAISMLFNEPELLQQMAPTFYKEFFGALDRKPDFKAEYFGLQELLNGTTEDLMKKRKESIRKGFQKAEELQAEYRKARLAISEGKFWEVARKMIEDENWSAIKIQNQSLKKGKTIADEDNIKYSTQEDKFADNDNYLLLYDIKNQIDIPMAEVGLTKEDLGEYMLLKRITGKVTKEEMPELIKDMEAFYEINADRIGDRAVLANPHGFNVKTALTQLDFLEQTLGEKNFTMLEEKAKLFHELIFKSVEKAVEVGAYSKKVFEEKILPNKYNYAYYQVVKHLEEFVSGRLETQKGTFEEISNPYIATILKTISLNYLNSKQAVKNTVIKELKDNHPDDISETEVKDTIAGRKLYGKPKGGKETITILEDGKQMSYDVDPMIAEMFQKNQYRNIATLMKLIAIPNNKIFKPLFTTLNPAFVLWNNPFRDQQALWKSITPKNGKVTWDTFITGYLKVLWTTIKSFPEASRYTKGNFSPLVRKLIETKAIVHPIQGYTYDPNMEGELMEMMKHFAVIAQDSGMDTSTLKYKLLQPFVAVADFMGYLSQTTDIASKISGAKLRMRQGEIGKQLAHNIRNYTGTPNWKVKGGSTLITNEMAVFSNIMVQGIKSSYELATNPTTRLGYWLKTMQINFIPALLLYALSKGMLGGDDDWGEEFMKDVSAYDKENYNIVPLGWYYPETNVFTMDKKAEKSLTRKAVYLRVPPDEQGRMLRATLWKGLDGMYEKDPKKLAEMLTVVGNGIMPSLSPAIIIPSAWTQAYVLDKNPYDVFRSRNIIDPVTWEAGGLEKLKKMTAWTLTQGGVVNIATYDTSKNTSVESFFQTAPFFSKVVKISNYGQQEALYKEGKKQGIIDKKALGDRNKIIDSYVERARNDKATIFSASKYRMDLIKEVLGGHLPKNKEEEAIANSAMTQFKLKLKKGLNYDPRVDALFSFTSNSQKLAVLMEIKSQMSPEEWVAYRADLVKDQIISQELSFKAR